MPSSPARRAARMAAHPPAAAPAAHDQHDADQGQNQRWDGVRTRTFLEQNPAKQQRPNRRGVVEQRGSAHAQSFDAGEIQQHRRAAKQAARNQPAPAVRPQFDPKDCPRTKHRQNPDGKAHQRHLRPRNAARDQPCQHGHGGEQGGRHQQAGRGAPGRAGLGRGQGIGGCFRKQATLSGKQAAYTKSGAVARGLAPSCALAPAGRQCARGKQCPNT